MYDSQVSATLDKADGMLSKTESSSKTSLAEYFAYAACAMPLFNLVVSVCTVCRCDYQITGHFPAQKSWVPANPKCSAPHWRGPSPELWFACGRRLITYCVCTVSRHASPFGNNVISAFFTDAKCQTIWVVTYNQEAYDEEGKATDIDVLEL